MFSAVACGPLARSQRPRCQCVGHGREVLNGSTWCRPSRKNRSATLLRIVERAFVTAIRRIRARALLTVVAILLVFGAFAFLFGAHAVLKGDMPAAARAVHFVFRRRRRSGRIGEKRWVKPNALRGDRRLLELLALKTGIVLLQILSAMPARAGGVALRMAGVTFASITGQVARRWMPGPFDIARQKRWRWLGRRARATLYVIILCFCVLRSAIAASRSMGSSHSRLKTATHRHRATQKR